MVSQYKVFASVLWLLKTRLLRGNWDPLAGVLTAEVSIMTHRSSPISHLHMRVNHWLQFLGVCLFVCLLHTSHAAYKAMAVPRQVFRYM